MPEPPNDPRAAWFAALRAQQSATPVVPSAHEHAESTDRAVTDCAEPLPAAATPVTEATWHEVTQQNGYVVYRDPQGTTWRQLSNTHIPIRPGTLASTIQRLLADTPLPAPQPVDGDGWPIGPDGISPAQVQQLIVRLLTDLDVTTTAQAAQAGLTIGRIQRCGFSDARARLLLRWFAEAGLIASPLANQSTPRPLLFTDSAAIRACLLATPCPERTA